MRRAALEIMRVRRVVAKLGVLDPGAKSRRRGSHQRPCQPEAHHLVDRLRSPPDCASSDRAAGQRRRDKSIARKPRHSATRCRRTPTANCWAARHPAPDRARCTSRACGLSRALFASMNHGCWSEVWFGTRSRISFRPGLVRALRPVRRNPPSSRTMDRCRYNRRCRSRNRPSATGRSATARPHRRQAASDKAAAR